MAYLDLIRGNRIKKLKKSGNALHIERRMNIKYATSHNKYVAVKDFYSDSE